MPKLTLEQVEQIARTLTARVDELEKAMGYIAMYHLPGSNPVAHKPHARHDARMSEIAADFFRGPTVIDPPETR